MLDVSSMAEVAEREVNDSSCWASGKTEEVAYDEGLDEQEVAAGCSLLKGKRKDCECYSQQELSRCHDLCSIPVKSKNKLDCCDWSVVKFTLTGI